MKKTLLYIISAGCIIAGSLFIYQSTPLAPSVSPSSHPTVRPKLLVSHSITSTHQATANAPAARHGFLWEKSPDPAINKRSSITLKKESFKGIKHLKKGQTVTLPLPQNIPALEGIVSHSAIQDDGTALIQITIPGEPLGTLTIQENAAYHFFEGHLTYQDHPVAYRFMEQDNSIVATRLSIEGIVCSQADNTTLSVDNGLPVFGSVVKARGGNSANKGAKLPRVSVANASITEGDSGSSNMVFQLTLSKEVNADVSVNFATSNNSASAGSDYTALSGSHIFASGETSKEVIVLVHGDTTEESDETFNFNILSADGADIGDATGVGTILDNDTPPSVTSGSLPILNSRPSSTAVAYLDMDGQRVENTPWNSGKNRKGITVTGVDSDYSTAKMTEIWEKVAEDFAPFDINVTTEESVYLDAPSNRRIRCIITPDWQWFGQAGGVAYLDSFTWTGDTPCWVFSSLLADFPKYIADATSHEIGHTLALYHDGRTSPLESYYEGHGEGATSWAPIMGVGYYKNLVHWSKGEYANSNNTENDLAIIVGQNGFDYRTDDHSAYISSATALPPEGAIGIIEKDSDTDVFSFSLSADGEITLRASGTTPDNNLDISLVLTDSSGSEVATINPINPINPPEGIDAEITITLSAGTYYAQVSGTGKPTVDGTGYSDYGSLGEYQISVTLP